MQSLVLSKLFYNDCVLYPIPLGLVKQMQKIQKAAASFVYGRYAFMEHVIKLNWLLTKQQLEWHTLKITHKALHDPRWPKYLDVKRFKHEGTLRSSAGLLLLYLRNCKEHNPFSKNTFEYLLSHAKREIVEIL